jgi:hypothetical protein
MYDLAGVAPVFAPKTDLWRTTEWADRWYLKAHIAEIGSDPRTREIAERYRVRYVALGELHATDDGTPPMDVTRLEGATGLHEVWQQGDARVFEIVGQSG